MALIKSLNSYLLNDISNIVYDYHFDSNKVNEKRKELINEYKNRILTFDNVAYEFTVVRIQNTHIVTLFTYEHKRHRGQNILKFDKKSNSLIKTGIIPPNY